MKFIPYLKYVLLILCIIAFVAGVASWDSTPGNDRVVTGGLEFLFFISAALVILTICSAVLMPLIGVFQNPKTAKRSLFGLVLVVIMFVVAYAMSSDEPITLANGTVLDNVADLRFADTALYAMYISFAGVLVSIVGSELYKIFK